MLYWCVAIIFLCKAGYKVVVVVVVVVATVAVVVIIITKTTTIITAQVGCSTLCLISDLHYFPTSHDN